MRRLLVVGALPLALWACAGKQAEEMQTEAAVPVQTAAVRQGAICAYVQATGLVEGAPGADWTIVAPQQARVAAVGAAAGDLVSKGATLVSFDSPQLRADLATRTGELAQARAKLENAQRSHERLSRLLDRGIASRKEVEDARRDLLDAEAALETATEAHAAALDLFRRAEARAPFDGIVAQRWHNPGDLVDANEHVLRVVDPRRLEVAAAVPASEVSRIVIARPARVTVSGSPTKTVSARVVSHPAVVDPSTGTAGVRLRLEGPLAVGTPVELEIAAEQEANALIVPASALLTEGGETTVFVVDAAKHARRRAVVVGIRGGGEVQLRSGVEAGEVVVVKGNAELPDGALVAQSR